MSAFMNKCLNLHHILSIMIWMDDLDTQYYYLN